MTLRRYEPMKPSRGTEIPHDLRLFVLVRDAAKTGGCVGFGRLPGDCSGPVELDHVRASHGMGMKSETARGNLVTLCGAHHRWKTSHGREARPILLEYLADADDCGHVDPVFGCPGPCQRVSA
jgi:5-methylcytosine-specific restriction endonuclease McrA